MFMQIRGAPHSYPGTQSAVAALQTVAIMLSANSEAYDAAISATVRPGPARRCASVCVPPCDPDCAHGPSPL